MSKASVKDGIKAFFFKLKKALLSKKVFRRRFIIAAVCVLALVGGLTGTIIGIKNNTVTVKFLSYPDYATGNGNYKKGDVITLEAEQIPGYVFVGWEYDGVIVSDSYVYKFVATKNLVEISLSYCGYTSVTVSGGEGAEGEAPQIEPKEYGSAFKLPCNTMTKDGCVFGGWLIDGELYEENDNFVVNTYKPIEIEACWYKEVSTPAELKAVADDLTGYYILTNDIDFDFEEITPIGDYTEAFSGVFDGNGYTVSDYRITTLGDTVYLGLFGYCTGKLCNLQVSGFTINVDEELNKYDTAAYIGGLVGYLNGGQASLCSSNGAISVTCPSYSGGLVGYAASGGINNCYSATTVTSTVYGKSYLGGLVGANYGYIANSFASGDVKGAGLGYGNYVTVGGLVGLSATKNVTNVYRSLAQKTVGATKNTLGATVSEASLFDSDWIFENLWGYDVLLWECGGGYPALYNDTLSVKSDIGDIEVSCAAELTAMGISGSAFDYVLISDISLSGAAWTPIGSLTSPFVGNFDGGGYVVSDCSITGAQAYCGFFGYSKGSISNLTIKNLDMDVTFLGSLFAGGLVGYTEGGISNCCVADCKISATAKTYSVFAGGLAGSVSSPNAVVSDCIVSVDLEASTTGGNYRRTAMCGGLIGQSDGALVLKCGVGGTVKLVNAEASNRVTSYVGGLVANNDKGKIEYSLSFASLSADSAVTKSKLYIGKLVGDNEGSITKSYVIEGADCDYNFASSSDAVLKYNEAYITVSKTLARSQRFYTDVLFSNDFDLIQTYLIKG